MATSLIGTSRTLSNDTMRRRTDAAIRQTAASKTAAAGSPGRLAKTALNDPSSVSTLFLSRISVNPAIADNTCADCGHSSSPDTDLLFVVDQEWDSIAEVMFGAPDDSTEE